MWLIDRDAKQFADWGIDYVKYDWKEWTLNEGSKGFEVDKGKSQDKTEAVTKRVFDDFRAQDRDIVVSLSPDHDSAEEDASFRNTATSGVSPATSMRNGAA